MLERLDVAKVTRSLVALLGFFGLSTLLHVGVGAYGSGFGGFEDEPSHLVTALMIRDWIMGGSYGDPIGYAENYYVHYPKVGITQWPPMFHGLLALWMLVMGTSTAAIVAFLSVLASLTAYVVYRAGQRPLGNTGAAVAGVVFLCSPIVQICSASAMTEILLALLSLLAVLSFGRFMDTGKASAALTFAAFAVLTIFTKGSGLALALVPPLAILMGRRFDLLRRPALWVAGGLVGLIAGPYYAYTLGATADSWAGGGTPSLGFTKFAVSEYVVWLPRVAGVLAVVAVPAGLAWVLRHGMLRGRWLAIGAWIPSLLVLHLLIPSSVEERHLSVLAPAWVLLAAIGAGAGARWLLARRASLEDTAPLGAAAHRASLFGVLVLLVGSLWTSGPFPRKNWTGWGAASEVIVSDEGDAERRILVVSDPVGEGLFVAGAALADEERPRSIVLRGSKVLCEANWSGREYRARFDSASEMQAWLDRNGVAVVVVDLSVRATRHWYSHNDVALEVVGHEPGAGMDRNGASEMTGISSLGWSTMGSWTIERGPERHPGALVAFVRDNWRNLPSPALRIEDVRDWARDGTPIENQSR